MHLRAPPRFPLHRLPLAHNARHITTSTKLSSSPSTSTPPGSDSTSTSVDPTELSHFASLATTWWDPHGPSRLLHLMNPLRHQFIRSCRSSTSTPPAPGPLTYLDIGCGGGIFAESAARLRTSSSVTALDPSHELIAIARSHARRDPSLASKLTYLHTSIDALPPPADPREGYDVVSLFEVVEHVQAPGPFLERCLPFVKPSGWLVLSTIARTWTSWAVTKVMAEDVLRMVPRGTHEWERYVNEAELRAWFDGREGWGAARAMGVVYVPGLGWKEVPGSETWGNYFFAVRRAEAD
ncbi:MAG: Hexaprenyldihydroxybenzoate methyltransferase, mitochondrial [Piccolia ochrophora]|nr:MAG: Hexaprenyldihydroxybenzoate methyltransferase, mitochondrial [Piccolia ochrophora]